MASYFRYTLSRPYPIQNFTYFVIIFFLIATILLSFFNTIITGYELRLELCLPHPLDNIHAFRVVYSAQPNDTLAEKQWYDMSFFRGMKKVKVFHLLSQIEEA